MSQSQDSSPTSPTHSPEIPGFSLNISPTTSTHLLLPLPTTSPSVAGRTSYVFSDFVTDGDHSASESLPPEVASADISISVDQTFIETPSGPAARELKRILDVKFGVGPAVRSPYAITAFVNQHGRQTYRIGRREQEAPGAKSASIEAQVSSNTTPSPSATSRETPVTESPSPSTSSKHGKRASRISVHTFLPQGKWSGTSTSRPSTATAPPRKLRKTRSNSDMFGEGSALSSSFNSNTLGRQHSHSVTETDRYAPHLSGDFEPNEPVQPKVRPRPAHDLFYENMDWLPRPAHRSSQKACITKPFGLGITYHSPSQKTELPDSLGKLASDNASHFLPMPTDRNLREMQSFESVLTAKQDDPQPDTEKKGFKTRRRLRDSVPAAFKLHRQNSVIHLGQKTLKLSTDRGLPQILSDNFPSSPESPPRSPSTPLAPEGPQTFQKPPSPHISLSPATMMQTRYTTEIFDLLQTSRGVPMFDNLIDDPNTVIRLSSTEEDFARPRDDPRFVIWGELEPQKVAQTGTNQATHSTTGSSTASSVSRKRSMGSTAALSSKSSVHLSSSSSSLSNVSSTVSQRVMIAATIERWIAQLTSELDYDELLNFFLTYRTYLSAVDLCHLLIARFHWSLETSPIEHISSDSTSKFYRERLKKDDLCRRIVRLRTFVAIRYWALTFFTIDFLPNRELRLLIAGWLNTLMKDPVLKKFEDGVTTVQKLRNIFKECQKTHVKTGSNGKAPVSTSSSAAVNHPSSSPSPSTQSKSSTESSLSIPSEGGQSTGETSSLSSTHVLGDKFAAVVRRQQEQKDAEDTDLDLDFFPEEGGTSNASAGFYGGGFQNDPANAHLSAATMGAFRGIGSGSTRQSLASDELMPTPFIPSPVAMPIHHSTLSRVFVNTIGRLGRWKRVLNSRASATSPLNGASWENREIPGSDGRNAVSAFDLELTASRDLLAVNGGVERYLQLIEGGLSPPKKRSVPEVQGSEDRSTNTLKSNNVSQDVVEMTRDQTITAPVPEAPSESAIDAVSQVVDQPQVGIEMPSQQITPVESSFQPPFTRPESLAEDPTEEETHTRPVSVASYHSSDSEDFGVPVRSRFQPNTPFNFDVVSIDELDFSDNSSDEAPVNPPGLNRLPRKLPLRRDFEFVQRESVSSMGIISRESIASDTSSARSSISFSQVDIGVGGIQPWQMNALLDSLSNDEEDGDVRTALQRLEGEINPKRQLEKEDKVNGWVRSIQKRMATGDIGDNTPRFLYGSDEDDETDETGSHVTDGLAEDSSEDGSQLLVRPHDDLTDLASTPVAAASFHTPSNATAMSPSRGAEIGKQPPLEDVVPLEILQSRVTAEESPQLMRSQPTIRSSPPSNTYGFVEAPHVPSHHSIVRLYHADVLAEHFAMIDRELFMGVRFEELVLGDWMNCQEVDVIDWAQFLKDRARWKAEARYPEKTSALAAVRARFNLLANFTISEVVLTRPQDRALVVSKFIRIALKSYTRNNFNALVAIMCGLKSDPVQKVMRRSWGRLTTSDLRMFSDFKEYTSSYNNFGLLKQAIDNIASVKSVDPSSRASVAGGSDIPKVTKSPVETSPHKVAACVPFIGVYLSQLCELSKLPDLIDPTAPEQIVGVDPETSNFDSPAHPEIFSNLAPLPPPIQLEPLINVHKQRMIAGVIKSLVTGQHLASKLQFPVDKKLFQKCLKLRALDQAGLDKALAKYPD
jgi:GDP/GTP exchange factor required for growth at low temperature